MNTQESKPETKQEPKPNPPEECFVCGQVKTTIGYQAFTGRAFCSSGCWTKYKRREGYEHRTNTA